MRNALWKNVREVRKKMKYKLVLE